MLDRRQLRSLRPGLWLLAIALAIRVFFALQMDHLQPRNDERAYMEIANSILMKGEYSSLFRPPGLPAFEAIVVKLGGNLETVRLLQSLLSTISIGLLGWLGWRQLGGRAAAIAVGILSVDPVSIGFSHLLWTETLFLFALCLFLAVWIPAIESGRGWRWLVAGIALGLCGLVRPVILTAAPLLATWALWRARREWKATLPHVVLLAVGAFAAVLPWSFRNLRATGSFVLVDTNGAYNFLIGTEPAAMFLDKDDTWSPEWAQLDGQPYGVVAARDPGYAQSRAVEIGFRQLLASPGRYLGSCWFEGTHLWSLDSFPLRHLRNGWYGPQAPTWMLPALCVWSILLGVPLLLLGFAGWLAMPPSTLRTPLLILIAHSAFLHAALFSLSRFQMPLRALLAIGAGYCLTRPRQTMSTLWRDGRPTRIGLAMLVIALVLVAAWWRDIPLFSDMLFHGGEAHRFERQPAPR